MQGPGVHAAGCRHPGRIQTVRPPQSSPAISHLAWGVTITVAVTVGTLLANWITAEVVAAKAERAAKALQAELAKTQRDILKQAEGARAAALAREQQLQLQLREQRRQDKEGRRLATACQEWRTAESTIQSETARMEAARQCGKLDNYVERGVLSR